MAAPVGSVTIPVMVPFSEAGGGVMTFVSKSGTNQYHGVAYDFLRNDDLDARGFFAQTRSVYKQNDFGGTAGGPVTIPKLYSGHNKTFFFGAYEGFRNRVGANALIKSIPTPEMYAGDFSNWVNAAGKQIPIYDPSTTRANPNGSGQIRDQFPGNIIPASRFSAFAKSVLPYATPVKPNRGGVPGSIAYVQNNFISTSGTILNPTDKGSMRVDQALGANQRLGFFYNRSSFQNALGAGGPPGLPEPLTDAQVQQFDTSAYRLSHDWTISPRLLNHFSIGGNKFNKNSYSSNSGKNWKSKVCLANAVDCNVNFPVLAFSDESGWGSAAYNGTEQPRWSIKNDLTYVRGAHNFKLGVAFDSQRANGFGQQNIAGRAGFSYLGTSVPGASSTASGSAFASFLLGWADNGNTETIRYVPQTFPYYGFFVQDDWHITRRLTMNIGLRYEFTRPPTSVGDQYSDFNPTKPNPAANGYPGALRFAGNGAGREGVRSLVPGWYGAFGPRLGLAYSPNDKTSFRTAFGRSFSKVAVVASSNHYSGFIGQYNFSSSDQDITPAFLTDTGLPSYPLPPQIDPAFANNGNVDYWNGKDATRAPENLYWTFSIQRQLSPSTVFEAAYNANVGVHLQTGLININQVPTAIYNQLVSQYGAQGTINLLRSDINSTLARAANIPIPYANFTNPAIQRSRTVNQALRPFPQYLNVVTDQGGDKSGHSNYQAMVLKIEKRFSQGWTMLGSYNFSKILTDSDTYYANGGLAQDQYNRGLEKSIGQYDQTHSVKFSSVYELPFGKGKRFISHGGLLNFAFGGWRLSAIATYASGLPIGLTRNNPLPLFNGSTRPTITSYEGWQPAIKGNKFDPNADKYLDKSVFPNQSQFLTFGNATRYNPKLRTFPNLNENISLGKSFRLWSEQSRLDMRAEAFNLFNRTIFGRPDSNLDSNTFGLIQSQSNAPRQLQMALKLYW